MIKTYQIEYDFTSLAVVEIDESLAPIKEMVEFWSDWEDSLEANDGDLNVTWLKNLARFILRERRLPEGDEGWCPLVAKHGIVITGFDTWSPDDDEIEVEMLSERES